MKARERDHRHLFLFSLLLAALALGASSSVLANDRANWTTLQRGESCIGGSRCGGYVDTLELHLDLRPIEAVRFYAHDDVGRHHNGRLRVAIDGYVLADYVDVARRGEWYQLDAHGARGRYLVLAALGNDEVVISQVEVLYGGRGGPQVRPIVRDRDRGRDRDRDRDRGLDRHGYNWREYDAGVCIGGSLCRERNGEIFEVALSGRAVHGIRFYANDQFGGISNGYLRVTLGRRVLEPGLDIDDHGRWYEIETNGVPARYLTFETVSDDEVVIEKVEVLYGPRQDDRDQRRPWGRRDR